MTLPNSYLVTTKNVEAFFNALLSGQAPERFTLKFLESLEFKSTNDRLFIGVLKFLKFIDENGVPTQRYYDFLDQSESKKVLAEAVRGAYADLFMIRKDANTLSDEEVKNKFKTLTQGSKSDKVLTLMANTFKALCEYADWSVAPVTKNEVDQNQVDVKNIERKSNMENKSVLPSLCYTIQIHLPETRDSSVYDAIFKSMNEHLFR